MTEFHPLQESNVYGVKFPGIEDGRAGMAMVTIREEYANADVDQLMRDLGKHTVKKLPKYAVPIFIRVAKEVEVTGTFKHKKVECG
jgi:acyl-CoA synthetase (AMP-forming)/AMP-acid ligase II